MNRQDRDQLERSFNDTFRSIRMNVIELQDEAYETGLARGKLDNSRLTLQREILQWANATFGEATADNTGERIRRFAEEAVELAQAVGLDKQAMLDIIEHVYAKTPGNVAQEIGQAGVSLLGLAQHLNIDADAEERKEFGRITQLPPEHWQARQDAKAAKGIALKSTPEESCGSFN